MAPDTVELKELTWPEVEAAIENGTRTVIIPVGSTEQHGPHLPLGTDAIIGEALGVATAEELGDAVVAPAIEPGCSGHHMAFPGSATIPANLLMDLLRHHCLSFERHGFEHLVLLPSHGGNFAPVNTIAPELADELAAQVIPLADVDRLMDLMNEGLRAGGVEYQEPVIHAGAAETAVIMAVAPDLVRDDELRVGHEGEVNIPRLLSEGFEAVTESGVLGDPREATSEAGEAIVSTIADAYAETIREYRGD